MALSLKKLSIFSWGLAKKAVTEENWSKYSFGKDGNSRS